MKILIIGATSMIGKALCRRLEGWSEIIAVVREGKENIELGENIEIVSSDMCNYSNIAEVIDGKIDAAVLLAWQGTRGNERNSHVIQKQNYDYNMVLIDELIKLNVGKIIIAGSQAEYGVMSGERMVDEKTEACPNTEYGKYKLKLYLDAKQKCDNKGITLIEIRIFSLYGPTDYENTLIMSTLKKMINNEKCNLTECSQLWNFLYIDDAIEAMVRLLLSDCEAGVYNLASKDTKTLKEFIMEMYVISESYSKMNFGTVDYPKTGKVNLNPSIEKLEAIGWKGNVSFEEGIRRILKKIRKSKDEL